MKIVEISKIMQIKINYLEIIHFHYLDKNMDSLSGAVRICPVRTGPEKNAKGIPLIIKIRVKVPTYLDKIFRTRPDRANPDLA